MKYCIYCMKSIEDTIDICPHCNKKQSDYLSETHVLPTGTILAEKYQIGVILGSGGFAITYIGINLLFKNIVCIKEFYPNGIATRNTEKSNIITSVTEEKAKNYFANNKNVFWEEAQALAAFRDEPGIVSVLDFFRENNTTYIVTEYLNGESLKSYLDRVGILSYDNALCLLTPVMDSLIKIHKQGIIHRDISPDNIMLVGEDVKLIDFGAARDYVSNSSLSVMVKHGYIALTV